MTVDRDDNKGRVGFQGLRQGQQRLHHQQRDEEPQQQADIIRIGCPHEKGSYKHNFFITEKINFYQLDSDGDGKLTFEEFKKMFDKIDLKNKQRREKEKSGSKHP